MELSESTNLSVIEARIVGNSDLFTAENLSTKFCFNNGRHWRKRKTKISTCVQKKVGNHLLNEQ